MTPYPASTMDSQPWTQYARSSVPDISMAHYAMPAHYMQHQLPTQHFMRDPHRPRSSPSTFGPSADSIQWPTTNGLGIYPNGPLGQPTPPVTSTFPPNAFQMYAAEEQYGKDDMMLKSEQYSTASPPEIKQPQPKRPYPSIAPNPSGSVLKRQRDDDEPQQNNSHQKKRKRTSSVVSDNLGEDDQFLVKLKEEEALPWKDIAARFQSDKNKTYNVAALQMKYKRLREKFRIWEEQDLTALRMAVEFWEKNKWEIVSAKVSTHSSV